MSNSTQGLVRAIALFTALQWLVTAWPAAATDPPSTAKLCKLNEAGDKQDHWIRPPFAEAVSTTHQAVIEKTALDYTATAGKLIVRDDQDKPIANVGYIAYVTQPAVATRPLLFAFNGGPGSSSLWLLVGALGPKRVVVSDHTATPPPPYHLVDNESSILDSSDIVVIDPIGTGVSHGVCDHKDEEFFGVDPDIDVMSRFVMQYVSDHNRFSSPKYLLGESYGTTRGAAMVNFLRNHYVAFNGVVLLSLATDLEAIFADIPGNDRPYPLFLPGYAAVAWYHKALPNPPASLEPFLTEVRSYANGPYAAALTKGDLLSDSERRAVANKIHDYTGLPTDYLIAAHLRVTQSQFRQQLLKDRGQTVGRLDARFVGSVSDLLAKDADYDPDSEAMSAAYAGGFLDYYHGELNFSHDETYQPFNDSVGEHWKWGHRTARGMQPFVNTGVDLRDALVKDSNLRVLVMSGYFDLGTPFSAIEYEIAHLGLPDEVRNRIHLEYYESGHMIYVNLPSLAKMKRDLAQFIHSTSAP